MFDVRPVSTAPNRQAVQDIYALCSAAAEWLPAQARANVDFASASVGESVHIPVGATGEVVGFVSVWACASFIHHLYVRPEFQSQGVGGLPLSSLESWLPTPWRLKCVRANQPALHFYYQFDWVDVASGADEQGPYAVLEWQGATL